eukprot:UN28631
MHQIKIEAGEEIEEHMQTLGELREKFKTLKKKLAPKRTEISCRHGLRKFEVSSNVEICDVCDTDLKKTTTAHGCKLCDLTACSKCFSQETLKKQQKEIMGSYKDKKSGLIFVVKETCIEGPEITKEDVEYKLDYQIQYKRKAETISGNFKDRVITWSDGDI